MKSQKKQLLLLSIFIFSGLFGLSSSVRGYIIPPGGGGGGNPEIKWGFFFWASDVGNQVYIDGYENILRSKGYITYDYKDSDIWTVLAYIDTLEDYNDKVFFYFYGHGYYQDDLSHLHYHPSYTIDSQVMKNYFTLHFEASDVAILIDSCHAGDFVDKFQSVNGYLVMTSTDESHEALYNKIAKEGFFSARFWWCTKYLGYTAVSAWNAAKNWYPIPGPQIVDNAPYNFF